MKISTLLKHPCRIWNVPAAKGCFDLLPDELCLRLLFRASLGTWPDLTNPLTFSEKIQWLKLHDRRPEYTMMADKYRVRDYVCEKIGVDCLIPLLGVWDDPDEIDFSSLPERFVLKCNHNSGRGMYICRDKSRMDPEKVKAELRRGLAQDYYLTGREWPYRNIPRKIICENYMEEDGRADLRDYKFFCFDGTPFFCQVISDRSTRETIDFFDMDWNHQPFTGLSLPDQPYPHSDSAIPRPKTLEQMKTCAAVLSEGHAFLRVDFYEINQKMYFGELTFYPASGFGTFSPEAWNRRLGDLLILPASSPSGQSAL